MSRLRLACFSDFAKRKESNDGGEAKVRLVRRMRPSERPQHILNKSCDKEIPAGVNQISDWSRRANTKRMGAKPVGLIENQS